MKRQQRKKKGAGWADLIPLMAVQRGVTSVAADYLNKRGKGKRARAPRFDLVRGSAAHMSAALKAKKKGGGIRISNRAARQMQGFNFGKFAAIGKKLAAKKKPAAKKKGGSIRQRNARRKKGGGVKEVVEAVGKVAKGAHRAAKGAHRVARAGYRVARGAVQGGIKAYKGGSSRLPGGKMGTSLPGGGSNLPGGSSRLPGGSSSLPGGASRLPGGSSFLGGSLSKHDGMRIFQGRHNTYFPALNRAQRRYVDYRAMKATHIQGDRI